MLTCAPWFRLDLSEVQVWPPGAEPKGEDTMHEVWLGAAGEPVALTLHVPDEPLYRWDWVEPFIEAPVVETPPGGYLPVRRATHVHFDVEDDVLSALRVEDEAPPVDVVRVCVAPDLELLFGDGAYRGWRLHRASQHLAHAVVPEPVTPAEADLPRLLGEFLQQTNRLHLPAILRKDSAQEERLRVLRRWLGGRGPVSAQRVALRETIDGVLGKYFRI